MDWFLERADTVVSKYFHKWYGFVALSFLFIVVSLIFYGLIPDGKVRFLWYAGGIIFFEICILIFWLFYTFWVPKCNQKHIGLVICIFADTKEAEHNLKRDFISAIEKKTQEREIGEVFDVKIIKNHLAPKYNSFKNINKLHKKTKGNIYIFGETKKRKNGDDQYFLTFDGLVLHRPVAQQVSQELSKDFLATLPKGIHFKDDFAFVGFQTSANIVMRSVEYVVGIASFISGNPFLATKLHEDLKKTIQFSPQKLPSDKVILNKIDTLLSNEYAIIANYYLNKSDKENTLKCLELSLKTNPNCYSALITQSIIAFVWEDDPQKALAAIKKCRKNPDTTWRYNEAFLRFWLGQYPSAWKQCEKIKKQEYSNEADISKDIIQFNENLLMTVEKPVLYFWLGFNYYFKQKNLPMALKNFEKFESKADASMSFLDQKTKSWIVEIKKQMNI